MNKLLTVKNTICRLNNHTVFDKNNFSLPVSFSNKGLKVFFGRKLAQESTVVTSENSISMSGFSKIGRKKNNHYFENSFLKSYFGLMNKKETHQLIMKASHANLSQEDVS